MTKTLSIRATPFSFGGIILAGLLLVLAALAYSGWIERVLFILLFAYFIDAWSEKLILKNDTVEFDSLFRRRKKIIACRMSDVLIVHEGLNQERGIVSVRFRHPDKTTDFLSLGPLWKRSDLEEFFGALEKAVDDCKLVEHVR
ncbi:hypothetical protein IT407_02445 [Candidatus Uhrbacteria bacterium]|nr:hypothetical protein [Candidatus Uhrbacteria bacterium]